MARHSAPLRTAPTRTSPRDGSAPRAAHRSALPSSTGRYATSAVVAAATLTGGALAIGDHSSVARAGVADAAFLATSLAPTGTGAGVPAAAGLLTASIQPIGLVPAASDVTTAETVFADTAAFDATALVKAVTLVETQ